MDEDSIKFSENLRVKTKLDAQDLEQYFGKILRMEADGISEIEIDNKHKYCAICLKTKVIKRYKLSTSSSNLRSHLRDKHNVIVAHKKTEKNQRLVSDMLTSVGQPQVPTSTPNSSSRRYMLARQICLWFCRDFISFNEVSKPGIRDFCIWAEVIQPNEALPDRKTLGGSALNDTYTSLYNFVHKFVQCKLPNTIPIAFDFWSDNVKRISYITYWIHWINSRWEMQKMCLKIAHFPHPHTGKLISEAFGRLAEEYNLGNKKFLAVTDNGKNLIKACKILRLEREPCLCHNLHLLVSVDLIKKHKDLQPIRDLIARMKEINKALVYKYDDLKKINDEDYNSRLYNVLSSLENINELLESTNVNISDFDDVEEDDEEMLTAFCNEQVRTGTQYVTIKNSNVTRWNSILSMFNSFEKNIDNINNCLASMKKYDMTLSITEEKLCSDFITVLQIFEKATDLLQGDLYPTLNLAIICYVEIKDSLIKLLAQDTCSSIVKTSAEFLLTRLDARFKITENMIVATFLDPSAQTLPLISEYLTENYTDIVSLLTKKWYEFDVELEPIPTLKRKRTPKKSTNDSSSTSRLRLELIKKHTGSNDEVVDNSIRNNIKREYEHYIRNCEVVADPLQWWKKNTGVFPYLSALAKVVLSIPASSGSTERHFSESGGLVTKKKAQLDPLNAQKIMFVHDNFKYAQA